MNLDRYELFIASDGPGGKINIFRAQMTDQEWSGGTSYIAVVDGLVTRIEHDEDDIKDWLKEQHDPRGPWDRHA